MASKYEITPLNSNKTILMIVKDIEKHLQNNPFYKVYFIDATYVDGTLTYDLSDVSIKEGEVLTPHDIIVFNNNYFAVVDAVGTTSVIVEEAILFKGDKGDTGATGATGATGNGIASIEKTSTSGLVDTYTITFTNGNSTTFDVTNGADGNGIASIEKTGSSGNVDTYTITFTNGNTATFTITNAPQTISADTIDSDDATNGQVLTANGSGGVSWENASGGSALELLWTGVSTSVNRSSLLHDITNYKALVVKTASVGNGFDSCDVILTDVTTYGCAQFSKSGTANQAIFYDIEITASVIKIINGLRLEIGTSTIVNANPSIMSIYGLK